MANTYLRYVDPQNLYNITTYMNKKLICVDVGSQSTGICVLDPAAGFGFPVTKLPDYPRTPFERALVQEYLENAGIARDPQHLPNGIEEGQLLPIQYITSSMTPEQMTEILNRVSEEHHSHGFVFSYSCYDEHQNDPAQYVHIQNMLSRLNYFGRLFPRLFTFANEFGSTNGAKMRLEISLPDLDHKKLFHKHRGLYQDDGVLMDDLSSLVKGYIDCYSAVVFGEEYLDDACSQNLCKGRTMQNKHQHMRGYALNTLGYTEYKG
ncbi:hypothetical protein Dsin_020600 [Dipteronia sinensis]|uniref:Uncharacterized protein n=1 Tax=Dipteronia sinensis TaxID=43782 RepID=A0AAE0AAB2_9ROSI|nr:hypothetical protein Dsin_020600 [Dipteronia sinensis]